MNYGYVRVSTSSQKIDRQIEAILNENIEYKNIYIDKESGADFERKNYKKLLRKLKNGDLLVIKSIDRLGRNYQKIIEEWSKITKEIGADIKVIDMPLLNTSSNDILIKKFISDIVLQILSFVAENERSLIKERQKEGIRIAKLKGVKFGRPKIKKPKNFQIILNEYNNNKINIGQACILLKISKATFYRMRKNN